MNKEAVIAIVFGLIIGLSVALLILFGPDLLTKLKLPSMNFQNRGNKAVRIDENIPDPTITENASNNDLIISEPEDRAIVNTPKITFKGKTTPESLVILLGMNNQEVIKSDKSGNFKTNINLEEGRNDIQISVYQESKQSITKTLKIYYSENL